MPATYTHHVLIFKKTHISLQCAQGNILEDASAIQILSEAKLVSNDITEKEVVATQTQKEIDDARVGYKPCGAFNAVLFFTIRDLVRLAMLACKWLTLFCAWTHNLASISI